jgi:DNA-binding Lrp family transcriptional regulator
MQTEDSRWNFFTNHAHVLFYLHAQPKVPLRRVALAVGITERAVQRIVAELEVSGCLKRTRIGRQNEYTIKTEMPLRHPLAAHRSIQDLLDWVQPSAEEADAMEDYKALENWTIGEHGSEV